LSKPTFDAYLDIETTGLSCQYCDITVIGIYLVSSNNSRFLQLVGRDVNVPNLLEAVEGVKTIYTYNGSRFDLPFIHGSLGINLETIAGHHDLMYDCWRCNLKGGFKAVERQLGITRELKDVDGWQAVLLWRKYLEYNDEDALDLLLRYNKEDVINLKALRESLQSI
jgi:uncharacterized protein YprB with RNaseH-like and TPR domain